MLEVVRLGVIGLRRGLNVVKEVANEPGVVITAVCDRKPEAVANAVKILGNRGVCDLKTYENFEEFLTGPIDAVYIATDATDHVSYVMKALAAGKHVLSEIPAVSSLEEAHLLRQAVESHPELKYMAAENCFYWNFIEAWKKMYEAGKLGTTVYAEAEYLHSRDYREIQTKNLPEGHWRRFFPAIKYITHDLGPLLHIMDDRCVSVSCMVPDVCYNANKTLEAQNGVALFKTAKGAVIRILICFGAYVSLDHNYRIIGTKGSLQTDLDRPLNDAHTFARFDDIPGSIEKLVEIPVTTSAGKVTSGHGGADKKMMLDFVRCIREDTKSPIDVDMGIRMVIPGIIAAQSSAQGGAVLEIPDL